MKNIAVATLFVILCIVISVVYGAEMAPCTKHSDCSKRELCFTAGGGKRSNGICSKKTMVEVGELAQQASLSFVEVAETKVRTKGNVAGVGELKLSAPTGKSATFRLGRDIAQSYSISANSEGEFNIRQGNKESPYLAVKGNSVKTNTKVLKGKDVDAGEGYAVGSMLQWGLAVSDTFDIATGKVKNSTRGWEAEHASMDMEIQSCGGVTMLGGPGAFTVGEVSKVYTGLRKHSAIRVVATFHMIDLWMGEYAYLKISTGAPNAQGIPESEYVWTQSYSAAASTSQQASGVNVCGDEQVVEMKFSVPIDISSKHSSDTLKVTFGTKLGKNAETNLGGASWGLSKVDLYLKSEQ
jgi:hypothetical protein